MSPREIPVTRRILQYIIAHPGCKRSEIDSVIPPTTSYGSACSMIAYLRMEGYIENRGGHGKAARWYWADEPESTPSKFYQDIAEGLLDELRGLRLAKRQEHLARRLRDIFGEP